MAICKGCGALIQWIETLSGKMTPINSDGTSHWSTCPEFKQFQKKKLT